MSIPNVLTVLRILLIPLFVIFLLREMILYALIVFAMAGVSDGLDGLIARWFDQRTVLGAYLDPLADKMLMTSAFISLAILKVLPSWLTVIVISRDCIIVIGIVLLLIFTIKFDQRPTIVGKYTTVSQLLTIFLVLLDMLIEGQFPFVDKLFWITAALTTFSGLHYVYKGMALMQNSMRNSPPAS
ncbi:MAG: CDP-diacylglycerol--glycerol-3-phosphate 3-phosphatidyltransferase [Desulfobacterales bacterium]|nr:CDP-diacylglycerol--glycerol-3-phosphate 3-phosphatidyltransferase [Desulfobacterales bacterium]